MLQLFFLVGIGARDLLFKCVTTGEDDGIHRLANEVEVFFEAPLVFGKLAYLLLKQANH